MKFVEKLRAKGVTTTEFAKRLGKSRAWGAQIYRGKNSKGDIFLLRPHYYDAIMQQFKFIRKTDFL